MACSSWKWLGWLAISMELLPACSDTKVELQPGGSGGEGGESGEGGAGGLGGTGGTGGAGGEGGEGGAAGGEPIDPAEPFFSGTSMPRIDITLTQESIDRLYAQSDAYVPGDVEVTLDGQVTELRDVGVRLKGVYGSFRQLDAKAAFLLSFGRFTDGQKLFGLKKLALNNMVQDPSMVHERTAYTLFRAMDVPAPRAAHATVWVNGSLYGLYTTVEAMDNPRFLERWLGDKDVNVYEGAYGSDLYADLVPSFDQDNGDDVGFADLYELAAALDGMNDPDRFLEEVSQVIDIDRYVAFAATEIFLGHWDGYAWTRNNYFIARRPDDGRWTFIPWGVDQTFSEYLFPFGGDGRIQRMCAASLPCRRALADAFERVVANVSDLGLDSKVEALRTFIWSDMLADPRKEVDPGTVSAYIDATITFLRDRPADVQASMICTNPADVDLDGDGSPGCGAADCDDNNPSRYPGAAELCDLVDNDCDGVLDNDPSCPSCVLQPLPAGGTAAFCFVAQTWEGAELDCVAQGGHLVSIHDEETQNFFASGAYAIQGGNWWIGLTDAASEGDYRWADGTPYDYSLWAGGEPNNAGGNENCGHMADWAGGAWNDIPCDQGMPYICRLP